MTNIRRGYTLLELMIAIAVLGIIAAVSIPSYQQYLSFSQINACARYIMPSRLIATNLISSNNGSVTGIDEVALGLANGRECSSISVNVAGQALTISGTAGGKKFQIKRSNVGGAWSCGIVGELSNTSCSNVN